MNQEPDNNDQPTIEDDVSRVEQENIDPSQSVDTEEYQPPVAQAEPTASDNPKQPAGNNKAVWIVMVVLALLIGGGLGYIFGNNFATTNNSEQDALQQQVTNLESDLAEAKDDLDEAQSDTTMDDKVTELEKENAALEQQVTDLEEQVAELKQELEDAEAEAASQDKTQ